jgi:hypothetical protein
MTMHGTMNVKIGYNVVFVGQDETVGTCGYHAGQDKCSQGFGGEAYRKKTTLKI